MVSLVAGSTAGAEEGLLITHGPRQRAQVALTFDVCQTPGRPSGYDRALIDLLRREQVPATFFVGGDWLRTHPAEGQELAGVEFFELGNHSWSHPDLRRSDAATIDREIAQTESALAQLSGRKSNRLFRLPFGYYDNRVLQAVTKNGLRTIQWDVVSGDPDPKVTAAAMSKQVLGRVRGGSIVIFHANGRGLHTAEALPAILAGLKARGLEPVTVSRLLAP
jgi:peptidoglycan/xylan/chitin deacetylase (PgdA/CDA1 family)